MGNYLIYDGATKIYEDDLLYQMQNKKALFKYDYNYFAMKKIPSFSEFKTAEKFMDKARVNEAIKVRFPLSVDLSEELEEYLKHEKYEIGKMHLYEMQTNDFKQQNQKDIKVKLIDAENYDDYAKLLYQENSRFGENYAKDNGKYTYEDKFNNPKHQFEFYVAYINEEAIGSLVIINHDDFKIELDDFTVLDFYQRRGVGTALQSKVMEQHPNKTIFLVADGLDTPKDMYEKQGYKLQFYWFEALKIIE